MKPGIVLTLPPCRFALARQIWFELGL